MSKTVGVVEQVVATVTALSPRGTATAVLRETRAVVSAIARQGPAGPPGRDAVGETYAFAITIVAPGQTVIPLPVPPARLSSVMLTVNGLAYRAPSLRVSDVDVTWLNPAFHLEPQDDIVLTYA